MILAIEEIFTAWLLGSFFAINGKIWNIYGVADAELIKALELKILYFGGECISGRAMSVGQVYSCLGQVTPGLCFIDWKRHPG